MDALRMAHMIRGDLIDLSYLLPQEASREILDAWSRADKGLYDLIAALEALHAPANPVLPSTPVRESQANAKASND